MAAMVGSGEHVYEWDDAWGQLPAGVSYGYTHGVCEDAQGRIYIHNMSKDAVVVFDADGTFIRSWGEEFGEGAHGMHLSREDGAEFLYLADIHRRAVYKMTLEGEQVMALPFPEASGKYDSIEGYRPTNVAVAPNGDIYVADGYGSSYVHRYNRDGAYLQTWGGAGEEVGKLRCPHGIWIDTRGGEPKVLVADRQNVRLHYFSLEGEPLHVVTHDLRHPCHFDQRGNEMLIPDLFGRVTIFDGDDNLVVHLGDNPGIEEAEGYPNVPSSSRVPGKFISPHAGIWDAQGNIYVVEWVSDGRVTKLRRKL